jgi:uncharacterized damage-inducible protein DinB
LTHIALSNRFQYRIQAVEKRSSFEGFDFPAFIQEMTADEAKTRSKSEIIELLKTEGEKWAAFVEGASEDFLAQIVTMPPGGSPSQRTRFDMILAVKEHEMHHRGQLMLMERMLGVVPHLTRQIQERMSQMMAKSQAKG